MDLEVMVPGDKSIAHRAAMLSAIANGISRIGNFPSSLDLKSTLDCLRECGAKLKLGKEVLTVEGLGLRGLENPSKTLDCGNSGTTMRLLAGLLCGAGLKAELDGDSSLRRRPMDRIVEPLRAMGAKIGYKEKEGFPPLLIRQGSRLRGMSYELPVPSAQVKGALLLAGLFGDDKMVITEKIATRDHTERMLKAMGAEIEFSGLKQGIDDLWEGVAEKTQVILHPPQRLDPLDFVLPGDASSAAFFWALAAAIPKGQALVMEVGINPARLGFLKAIKRMGAKVEFRNVKWINYEPVADVEVRGDKLQGIKVEAWEVPSMIDELMLLAVLGTKAEGGVSVSGAAELRVKESDRISAIVSQLKKMGAQIEEKADGFKVDGKVELEGAMVDSLGDHRLVMALALAGLLAKGKTTIQNAHSISISYPEFPLKLALLQKS